MKWLRIASIACAFSLVTMTVQAQDAIPPGSSSVNEINEAIAAAGKRNVAPPAQRLQGFSVALLVGEAQGSTAPDGLSAPARKALADIKDFLPYKAYRVLDTQWIAGTERGGGMQFRLRGLGTQEYEFTMSGMRVDAGSQISAMVMLRTPGIDKATRDQATARLAQLEDLVRSANTRRAETEREIAQLKQTLAGGQTLISTTLGIGMGETVVVGTSRVQGDTALIVLLSAVPR
jgi:hypothetical protein